MKIIPVIVFATSCFLLSMVLAASAGTEESNRKHNEERGNYERGMSAINHNMSMTAITMTHLRGQLNNDQAEENERIQPGYLDGKSQERVKKLQTFKQQMRNLSASTYRSEGRLRTQLQEAGVAEPGVPNVETPRYDTLSFTKINKQVKALVDGLPSKRARVKATLDAVIRGEGQKAVEAAQSAVVSEVSDFRRINALLNVMDGLADNQIAAEVNGQAARRQVRQLNDPSLSAPTTIAGTAHPQSTTSNTTGGQNRFAPQRNDFTQPTSSSTATDPVTDDDIRTRTATNSTLTPVEQQAARRRLPQPPSRNQDTSSAGQVSTDMPIIYSGFPVSSYGHTTQTNSNNSNNAGSTNYTYRQGN